MLLIKERQLVMYVNKMSVEEQECDRKVVRWKKWEAKSLESVVKVPLIRILSYFFLLPLMKCALEWSEKTTQLIKYESHVLRFVQFFFLFSSVPSIRFAGIFRITSRGCFFLEFVVVATLYYHANDESASTSEWV